MKRQDVLISPFMEALNGKKLKLDDLAQHDCLLPAYSMLHQRLARGIRSATELIDAEETRRSTEGLDQSTNGNPLFAIDAFLDLVNRAAEIFEFYEKDLVAYFDLGESKSAAAAKKEYLAKIKSAKRTWVLLCNRCKHNHASLIPIEGVYESGEWVTGFSLYQLANGKLSVVNELHGEAHAFSYNWSIRSVLSDVMAADLAAADFVRKLNDDVAATKLETMSFTLPYLDLLSYAANRPKVGMPREQKNKLSEIELNGSQISFLNKSCVSSGHGTFNMRVILNLLGGKVNFQLPFQLGELSIEPNCNSASGGRRLVFQNLLVAP